MNLLFLLSIIGQLASAEPSWVGAEESVKVVVKGTAVKARKPAGPARKPAGPARGDIPPLVVVAVNPVANEPGTYEIRVIGLKAGEHDLRDYLEFSDGVTRQMLSPMTVRIADPLPPTHRGELETPPILARQLKVPGLGRTTMAIFAGLWTLGLTGISIAWWKKTHRARTEIPDDTLEEELPKKLQLAEMNMLTPQGLAEIELALLDRWRRELNVQPKRKGELITALQSHPRGRELLAAFEQWCRRLDQGPAELPPLLKEYAKPTTRAS